MPSRHSPESNTPHRTLWSGWLAALLTLLWSVASRPNEQQWPLVERTSDLVWAVAQFHSPSFQTCPFHIRLFSVSWPWPWIRWIHFHWRRDDDGQSERGRRKNKFLLLRKWNIFQTGISKCLENANEVVSGMPNLVESLSGPLNGIVVICQDNTQAVLLCGGIYKLRQVRRRIPQQLIYMVHLFWHSSLGQWLGMSLWSATPYAFHDEALPGLHPTRRTNHLMQGSLSSGIRKLTTRMGAICIM